MSKVRNPKEKKRLSLERDHRVLIADSNSRQRANAIRIVKKSGNRAIRRKERLILHVGIDEPENLQEIIIKDVPMNARGIRKSSNVTLGQYLDPEIRATHHDLRHISPIKKEKRVPFKTHKSK